MNRLRFESYESKRVLRLCGTRSQPFHKMATSRTGFVAFRKDTILRKQVLFCRVKISLISQKAYQNFHLLAVRLNVAAFP